MEKFVPLVVNVNQTIVTLMSMETAMLPRLVPKHVEPIPSFLALTVMTQMLMQNLNKQLTIPPTEVTEVLITIVMESKQKDTARRRIPRLDATRQSPQGYQVS